MSLRFRQTFTLFPGVRINVGKRGISTSIGVPGATVNVGRQGVRATVGLPGTGLGFSTTVIPFTSSPGAVELAPSALPQNTPATAPVESPAAGNTPASAKIYMPVSGMNEISSASVEVLTSTSLLPLRDMIAQAREQRTQVTADLKEAKDAEAAQQNELHRRRRSLFRWFYKRRIAELEVELPVTQAEVARLIAWEGSTKIDVTFESRDAAQRAYAEMVRLFEALRQSAKKWDVTSHRAASRVIDRHPVRLEFSATDLIRFPGRAMRFENVNGDDILIYPGVAVIPRADGAFALIDIRELSISAANSPFQEEDGVPKDAEVIGHTWAKANKDGSPDRRFKDNHQIPICRYGRLAFQSGSGVTEEYMFSNAAAAEAFAAAVSRYQAALAVSEGSPEGSAVAAARVRRWPSRAGSRAIRNWRSRTSLRLTSMACEAR